LAFASAVMVALRSQVRILQIAQRPGHAPRAHASAILRFASDCPRCLQKPRAARPESNPVGPLVRLKPHAPPFFVRSALLKSRWPHDRGAAQEERCCA
jgi:hypothetical protein